MCREGIEPSASNILSNQNSVARSKIAKESSVRWWFRPGRNQVASMLPISQKHILVLLPLGYADNDS